MTRRDGGEGKPMRGELYWVELQRAGGRLKKRRPVLVVQNEIANRFSPETIVVAVRDARESKKPLPVFVRLAAGTAGLRKDSFVDAAHIHTISQHRLQRKLGRLSRSHMQRVDSALLISLGLD